MTPKERAAMQQALDALHNTQNALLFVSGSIEQFIISKMTADAHDDADKAITALREALVEQAEQEPVHVENVYKRDDKYFAWIGDDYIQIYAAPVRTKDLTPHEITALIRKGAADGGWQGFAQRVIAADRELNK